MRIFIISAVIAFGFINVAQASNTKKLARAIKESNLELVQYLLKYKTFTAAQLLAALQQGEKERAPLLASTVFIESAKFGFLVGASLMPSLRLKDYLTGKLDREADERNMAAANHALGLLDAELAGVATAQRRLEITQTIQGNHYWMNDPQRKKTHLETLRGYGIKSFLAGAAVVGLCAFVALKAFYRGYNHAKLALQVSREVAQARAKALLFENGKQ